MSVIRVFAQGWLAFLCAGACAQSDQIPSIRPGIDVLLTDSMHLVRGARVGLVTNQTGIDASGVDDVTRMIEAGVNLTTLFSPEHGFRGALDQANIDHAVDSATGLPIYSLYGEVRVPTAEMLTSVDVLIVDLQDIGSRTYTYVSTAIEVMRAARGNGRRVIVLDRPNPIGGSLMQGPILDPQYASFVGMLPVPLRHGMTMGELALMANDVLDIGAMLQVVPAGGWTRSVWFDETGLPWVRPSPNMPSLESATHYPGTVLFEATNLTVGRGTPIAFQVLGAPWLPAARIAERLAVMVSGVHVKDTTITPLAPTDGKHDGITVPALRFQVTDRAIYDPTVTAVETLRLIRELAGDSLTIRNDAMDRLAGTDGVRRVSANLDLREAWEPGLVAFRREVQRYLLYR